MNAESRLNALNDNLGLSWKSHGLAAWYPGLRIERVPTASGHKYCLTGSGQFGFFLGSSEKEAAATLRRMAAR